MKKLIQIALNIINFKTIYIFSLICNGNTICASATESNANLRMAAQLEQIVEAINRPVVQLLYKFIKCSLMKISNYPLKHSRMDRSTIPRCSRATTNTASPITANRMRRRKIRFPAWPAMITQFTTRYRPPASVVAMCPLFLACTLM